MIYLRLRNEFSGVPIKYNSNQRALMDQGMKQLGIELHRDTDKGKVFKCDSEKNAHAFTDQCRFFGIHFVEVSAEDAA